MVDEFNANSQDDILIEQGGAFAGEADGFGRLWTPHRMAYIEGERPTKDAGHGCPFCASPTKTDADGLIVHRGEHCFVVMNLFPYNPGHLLVCPYRHVASYIDLTDDETEEFTKLTKAGVRALKAASNPGGFNLGMNQGDVAGAGVAAHLHQHIVPRWGGDMNFMPIIGRTKALPVLLEDSRQRIVANWPND
ncbi:MULTISPECIES: HIT family protein [Dermacoccus]|uniref:HIT family protein n=1 Tax=Dermacoccus TaxID=57495 RepID=UPI001F514F01|nr:HIT domain-containing protein [Dermacoccus nishinomiyaensis]MCI0152844.1 HIT domain-containing protein [Dermacoccus nishinomiyaensis]